MLGLFGLSVDDVLAIDPGFVEEVDRTEREAEGLKVDAVNYKAKSDAAAKSAKACEDASNRKMKAVDKFRRASGGEHAVS